MDGIYKQFIDLSIYDFESWLGESIISYLTEKRETNTYISVKDFLLYHNCIELPAKEMYEYVSVKLLKAAEDEYLRKIVSKNPNTALILMQKETGIGRDQQIIFEMVTPELDTDNE